MEFSYKLSEEDYLQACEIRLPLIPTQMQWWESHAYMLIRTAFMVIASAFGLFWGMEPPDGMQTHFSLSLFGFSLGLGLMPGIGLSWLCGRVFRFLHPILSRRRIEAARRAVYRADPTCHSETTLNITSEQLSFRCGTDRLIHSGWSLYDHWVESPDILLLVTHWRVRWIVNITGLSQAEREELRGILTAALPQKK